MRNVKQLITSIESGNDHEYIYFWGHQGSKKGCLSQWFESSFVINGVTYKTAEHWMMAQKARLFGDVTLANQIVQCRHPRDAKQLGRAVRKFNNDIWNKHKFAYVVDGNIAKFQQNPSLKKFLLSTGNKVIVESSPVDSIWGVGLHMTNPDINNPTKWKGENLLGFALMEVREQLK